MKHLLFLFASKGNATPGTTLDWKPSGPCGEFYNTLFYREGYFVLLEKLLKNGLIDKVTIIFESNNQPGFAKWIDREDATCLVVPEIEHARQFITDETIIWVRGGFKHWYEFLLEYKEKNWLLFYGANTGRERWKFWDIIFDDLKMNHEIDKYQRYTFPFIKPIDSVFFKPTLVEQKYDVCINASHIHDKKGQWRTWEVLKRYHEIYGEPINAVLPGASRGGIRTRLMFEEMKKKQKGINVFQTGFLDKSSLISIYNESKIFFHLGTHGQNDRGPLEALSCGCFLLIGSPNYHTVAIEDSLFSTKPIDINEFDSIAVFLHGFLKNFKQHSRLKIAEKFRSKLGLHKSCLLFSMILNHLWGKRPTLKTKEHIYEMMKPLLRYLENKEGIF